MKKSGTLIFLMELMVVIMFFSLSVLITLRIFITADNKVRESADISETVSCLQNIAEKFKAYGGDAFTEDGWVSSSDKDNSIVYIKTENGIVFQAFLMTQEEEYGTRNWGALSAYREEEEHQDKYLCSLQLSRYVPKDGGAGSLKQNNSHSP